MRRRALLRTLLGLGMVLVASAGTMAYLLLREPSTYRNVTVPDGPERRELSGKFVSSVNSVKESMGGPAEMRWYETFTADQINSYFEEDFLRLKPFQLPPGLHSPRVMINPNHFQLAFRLGHGFWSTVITVDLNLWLVVKETNVIAVEVLGVHAGDLPISVQSFLEDVAEKARNINAEVTWYRNEGHPVALIKFQADQDHPTFLLQRLELQDGRIVIAGKSNEAAPLRAMLTLRPPVGE